MFNKNHNNSDWKDIMEELRSLFLTPTEDNKSILIRDIETILSHIPNDDPDNPYIGKLGDTHEFLDEFEKIPVNPGNQNSILSGIANIFSGAFKFQHPQVMHNVTPSPIVNSVAAAAISHLYNLNPAWDFISAGAQKMERQVIRQLASYVGWTEKAAGISTFGGKGCITYAIRIGLNRCLPDISSKGISHNALPPVVITSKSNHQSIDTACSLLGIGYENCWRSEVNDDETMEIESFKKLIKKACSEGYPIAAIILSGGNTLHLSVDDLRAVSDYTAKMVKEYKLGYHPYIYFDSCVAWPWIFFINYDFKKNSLGLPSKTLEIIEKSTSQISAIAMADGCGFDFHKTGNNPYATSIFMTKNEAELNCAFKNLPGPFSVKAQGNNFLYHCTIEHSRTATSILAAWTSLQSMGLNGYRSYIGHLITIGCQVRDILPAYGMELLNPFSLAPASVFFPFPRGFSTSYWDLINGNKEIIEKFNIRTFQLFKYFQDKSANHKSSFIFRFIPQYRQAKCGISIAVLVIYPMSVFLTQESMNELLHVIGGIKNSFDLINKYEITNNSIPTYVPR